MPEGCFLFGVIGQWVVDIVSALGYLGLALLLIAENLFPPIPSESFCHSPASSWAGAT